LLFNVGFWACQNTTPRLPHPRGSRCDGLKSPKSNESCLDTDLCLTGHGLLPNVCLAPAPAPLPFAPQVQPFEIVDHQQVALHLSSRSRVCLELVLNFQPPDSYSQPPLWQGCTRHPRGPTDKQLSFRTRGLLQLAPLSGGL
jgi:hypothetical protein